MFEIIVFNPDLSLFSNINFPYIFSFILFIFLWYIIRRVLSSFFSSIHWLISLDNSLHFFCLTLTSFFNSLYILFELNDSCSSSSIFSLISLQIFLFVSISFKYSFLKVFSTSLIELFFLFLLFILFLLFLIV